MDLDAMYDLMRSITPQPKREIRCGRAAWDVLRSCVKADNLGPAEPLAGWPVHVDPKLTDGAWQILKGDRIVQSGDMAPGFRRAIYVSGIGLVGVSDELAAQVIDGIYERFAERTAVNRPHPTCIDVTAIDQTPRSEWICGPECPKEA